MEVEINHEDKELIRQLRALRGSEVVKAAREGSRGGARILSRETYKNFAHLRTKNRRGSGRLRNRVYDKTAGRHGVLRTVRVLEGRKSKTGQTSRGIYLVNILGDFIAKFFERGTDSRATISTRRWTIVTDRGRLGSKREGKGRRTGRIMAGHYFARAQRSSQQAIENEMKKAFVRTIERISKQ